MWLTCLLLTVPAGLGAFQSLEELKVKSVPVDIDRQDAYAHHLTITDALAASLSGSGERALGDEAFLINANIHERTEAVQVANFSLDFHPRREVLNPVELRVVRAVPGPTPAVCPL